MKPGIILPKKSIKTESRGKFVQFFERDISFSRKSLSTKQKIEIFKTFETLTEAGIDLISILNISIDGASGTIVRKTLLQLSESVHRGNSLAQAFKETNLFSDFEISSLKVGEETGRLVEVLKELVRFFSTREETRRRIVSLAAYPSIVFLTAIGAVGFMLYFVVPMFTDIFLRFGHELPLLTKIIIRVSGMLSDFAILILGILLGNISFIYFEHKKIWYKRLTSKIIMNIPAFNKLILTLHLGRFCMSMELLLSSKTPLVKSLQLVKGMINFFPLATVISSIEEDVTNGTSFYLSLSKHKVFDKRFCSMIKVAEEVNQLDTMFKRLKQQFITETEYKMTILSNILEPLIIVIMGIFVAIILIAMYLPIFKLGVSVGEF